MPLWRTPTELQFGTEPDAPRLSDVSRAQERLIRMLYKGMPNTYLKEAAKLLALDNAEQLLEQLSSVMMDVSYPQVDEDFVARNFAEICRAQSTYNHSGESIIAQRKLHGVFVSEVTDCGKLIIEGLENSGIGQVSDDQSKNYDFAVLIASHVIAPKQYSHWLNSMVPHLAVIFDSEGVIVTPVIETGKTPCLSCFHEQQIARDSAWPEIASQLLFSEQKFDDSTSRFFGAAIASQRALATVDELASFSVQDRNLWATG